MEEINKLFNFVFFENEKFNLTKMICSNLIQNSRYILLIKTIKIIITSFKDEISKNKIFQLILEEFKIIERLIHYFKEVNSNFFISLNANNNLYKDYIFEFLSFMNIIINNSKIKFSFKSDQIDSLIFIFLENRVQINNDISEVIIFLKFTIDSFNKKIISNQDFIKILLKLNQNIFKFLQEEYSLEFVKIIWTLFVHENTKTKLLEIVDRNKNSNFNNFDFFKSQNLQISSFNPNDIKEIKYPNNFSPFYLEYFDLIYKIIISTKIDSNICLNVFIKLFELKKKNLEQKIEIWNELVKTIINDLINICVNSSDYLNVNRIINNLNLLKLLIEISEENSKLIIISHNNNTNVFNKFIQIYNKKYPRLFIVENQEYFLSIFNIQNKVNNITNSNVDKELLYKEFHDFINFIPTNPSIFRDILNLGNLEFIQDWTLYINSKNLNLLLYHLEIFYFILDEFYNKNLNHNKNDYSILNQDDKLIFQNNHNIKWIESFLIKGGIEHIFKLFFSHSIDNNYLSEYSLNLRILNLLLKIIFSTLIFISKVFYYVDQNNNDIYKSGINKILYKNYVNHENTIENDNTLRPVIKHFNLIKEKLGNEQLNSYYLIKHLLDLIFQISNNSENNSDFNLIFSSSFNIFTTIIITKINVEDVINYLFNDLNFGENFLKCITNENTMIRSITYNKILNLIDNFYILKNFYFIISIFKFINNYEILDILPEIRNGKYLFLIIEKVLINLLENPILKNEYSLNLNNMSTNIIQTLFMYIKIDEESLLGHLTILKILIEFNFVKRKGELVKILTDKILFKNKILINEENEMIDEKIYKIIKEEYNNKNTPNEEITKIILEIIIKLCSDNNEILLNIKDTKFKEMLKIFKEENKNKDRNYSINNPYIEKWKIKTLNGVGLKNLGNTCYINSVIQQFFHIPYFKKYLLQVNDYSNKIIDDNPLRQLQKLFIALRHSNKSYITPSDFCDTLATFNNTRIDISKQQDVHQFLDRLFYILGEKLEETYDRSLLNDIFKGEIESKIICEICNKVSIELNNFFNLSLEVKSMNNLNQSLDKFIQEEIIEDYFCWNCLKLSKNVLKKTLNVLPKVLIVHLQRITHDNQKINSRFEFPVELNLKNYSDQEQNEYVLNGVIVHVGHNNQGHYISYVNTNSYGNSEWLCFDDSYVTPFDINKLDESCFGGNIINNNIINFNDNFKEFHSEQSACILFYQKIENNPISIFKDYSSYDKLLPSIYFIDIINENISFFFELITFNPNFNIFFENLISLLLKFRYDLINNQQDFIQFSELLINYLFEIILISNHNQNKNEILEKFNKLVLKYPKISEILLHYLNNNKKELNELIFSREDYIYNKAFRSLLIVAINSNNKNNKDEVEYYMKVRRYELLFIYGPSSYHKAPIPIGFQIFNYLINYELICNNKNNIMNYFEFFKDIVKTKNFTIIIEYLYISNLIKILIQLTIRNKNNNLNLAPMLEIIATLVNYCHTTTWKKLSCYDCDPKFINIPPHTYIQISNEPYNLNNFDVASLEINEFYLECIKSNYNNLAMSRILAHLSYNNYEFTKKSIFWILEELNNILPSPTNTLELVKNIFDLLSEIILIDDIYTMTRLEWIFGFPELVIHYNQSIPHLLNNISINGDKLYKFNSVLIHHTNYESLMENILYKFYNDKDFLRIINLFFNNIIFHSVHAFRYFDSLPHPNQTENTHSAVIAKDFLFELVNEEINRLNKNNSNNFNNENEFLQFLINNNRYDEFNQNCINSNNIQNYKYDHTYKKGLIYSDLIYFCNHFKLNPNLSYHLELRARNLFLLCIDFNIAIKPNVLNKSASSNYLPSYINKYDSPLQENMEILNSQIYQNKSENEFYKWICNSGKLDEDIKLMRVFINNKPEDAIILPAIRRYFIYNLGETDYKLKFRFIYNKEELFMNCRLPNSEIILIIKGQSGQNLITLTKVDHNIESFGNYEIEVEIEEIDENSKVIQEGVMNIYLDKETKDLKDVDNFDYVDVSKNEENQELENNNLIYNVSDDNIQIKDLSHTSINSNSNNNIPEQFDIGKIIKIK